MWSLKRKCFVYFRLGDETQEQNSSVCTPPSQGVTKLELSDSEQWIGTVTYYTDSVTVCGMIPVPVLWLSTKAYLSFSQNNEAHSEKWIHYIGEMICKIKHLFFFNRHTKVDNLRARAIIVIETLIWRLDYQFSFLFFV